MQNLGIRFKHKKLDNLIIGIWQALKDQTAKIDDEQHSEPLTDTEATNSLI